MIFQAIALRVLCSAAVTILAEPPPTQMPTNAPGGIHFGHEAKSISTGLLFGVVVLAVFGLLGIHLFYFFCIKKVPFGARYSKRSKYNVLTPSTVSSRQELVGVSTYRSASSFLMSRKLTADAECNSAFVFLKPHTASSSKLVPFVQNFFTYRNMTVAKKGVLTISSNLWENLIDKTFTEAYRRAAVVRPDNYPLSNKEKLMFFFHFGENWDDCVQKRIVLNAVDTCSYLGVSRTVLLELWVDSSKDKSRYAELSNSFKCCYIDNFENKPAVYCINGFYLGMRQNARRTAISVPYFVIEWKLGQYTWQQFMQNIVGDENPVKSDSSTLRGTLYRDWEVLGMNSCPNIVDNCFHASESAFAAFVEKKIWIPNWNMKKDFFFSQLKKHGIELAQLKLLEQNPIVLAEGAHIYSFLKNQDAVSSIAILKQLGQLKGDDLVYEINSDGISDLT